MTLPFIERQKGIGKAGLRAERRAAKRMGGKQTPGSGNLKGGKGDFYLTGRGTVMVEAKSTTGLTIKLEYGWLNKVAQEARQVGKDPALSVTFATGDGNPRPSGAWVMIPEATYQEMIVGFSRHVPQSEG